MIDLLSGPCIDEVKKIPSGPCDAETEAIKDVSPCNWSQQPQLPDLGGSESVDVVDSGNVLQEVGNILAASTEQKILDIVEHVAKNKGSPKPGYKGGAVFKNDGRDGSAELPQADSAGTLITYKEYDLDLAQKNKSRGAERIVVGSNGRAYYTRDH